ncbi:MAG TPA: VOC family protein [Dehalococcoidia bacterium]|nr:VOC family protein [Dehalococcoidia bacterium]
MAMRLNHITLVVTDLVRSKEFYRKLGLIQIVDTPPRYARFRMPDGDATLSVEVIEGSPPNSASAHFFFECEDVDATVSALKAQGIEFYQEPTDMFYAWREARLRDPDGHDIRLYTENAKDVRLNPPWKIPGT